MLKRLTLGESWVHRLPPLAQAHFMPSSIDQLPSSKFDWQCNHHMGPSSSYWRDNWSGTPRLSRMDSVHTAWLEAARQGLSGRTTSS